MNPFSAIAEYFLGRIKQRVYQTWCTLLFEISMSMLGTFLFVAGGVMTAAAYKYPSAALVAGIGSGMVSSAVVLVVLLRRSPLTSGMMFVFPGREAEAELEADLQVIQKN